MGTKRVTQITESFIEHFWSNVAIGAPDQCWPWGKYVGPNGYGFVSCAAFKECYAHRLALIFVTETKPERGLFALHSCDNKVCCNPQHLRWGTQADNIHDAIQRGRRYRGPNFWSDGTKNKKARFTSIDVAAIRASSELSAVLELRYGVCRNSILNIRSGRTYRNEPGAILPRGGQPRALRNAAAMAVQS